MTNPPQGVAFSPRAAERLIDNSKDADYSYRAPVPGPGIPSNYPGFLTVKITQQVSGMNGATPGQGKGILQVLEFPGGTSYANYGSTAYPVFNNNEKKIAVEAYVFCVQAYGRLMIVQVDKCASLS